MYYIYTNLEWLFKNSLFKKKKMQPSHQAAKQPCTDCLGNGKKTLKKCTHQKKLNLMPFFALERLNCCTQEEKGKHQVKKAEKVHIYKLKQVNKKNWIDGA